MRVMRIGNTWFIELGSLGRAIRRRHMETAAIAVCLLVLAILSLALLIGGCAAKVPASGTTPGRNGTPIENALAYNASLAEANKVIAQTVIDASNGAAPLIPVASANKILIMQSKVADADRQLTPLLSDVGNLQKNATRIEQLLDDIKGAAGALVSSGDLGIKDAATQTKIASGITNVYNLADVIINTLVQGGLIPKGTQ
jgi:hypothetical protein